MPAIAETAQIDPSTILPEDLQVGHFSVVGRGVRLGEGVRIGNHVVIHEGTIVGKGCRIDDHAVIGKQPMRAARSATTASRSQPAAVIGDGVTIGTSAIVYAGCEIADGVLIADQATVREDVRIGEGTIVGRGVAIENKTTVGARCKLETNVYLCAYSRVGDDVFVAPGVLTSNDRYLGRTEARLTAFGGPTVESRARLAVGAVLLPGTNVPSEAVVGAGAVLTRDAVEGQVHLGVPARPTRPVAVEQRLDDS